MRSKIGLSALGIVLSFALSGEAHSRELSFDERVAAQRAIEQVLWDHRIWPEGNPSPKPSFSTMVSDKAIQAMVTDSLKKSAALETLWRRPVTAAQLQAEIDRMTSQTRDPRLLRELFAALGDDPLLIAETIARSALVDRLLRSWYASDERIHGITRREAERALLAASSASDLKHLGGEYFERTIVRHANADRDAGARRADGRIEMDTEEWARWRADLGQRFGAAPEAIPTRTLSPLQEEPDRFFVTAVLKIDAGEATIATVSWPKRAFDDWWSEEAPRTSAAVAPYKAVYTVTMPSTVGCTSDTWDRGGFSPGGVSGRTAVWTGTQMIVWGGISGSPYSGGRYNPATDQWTEISRVSEPAPRGNHVAVWTGTEMIVWGGLTNGPEFFNDGGRYNPATNSWAPIGPMPLPGRSNATAVWTGTEMIVWGGYTETPVPTTFNSGGRYRPSTNTWTPTPTAGAPEPRFYHTAVWTGSKMLVWGGASNSYDPETLYSSGGIYDPSSNSWIPTSSVFAPDPRFLHTAVWTGSRMLVWGGATGSFSSPTAVNTGASYDPVANSWTPIPTGPGVPSPRGNHEAVWTGTVMVVWGASSNPGGRFNPSTSSWTPTATVNAPALPGASSSVWTGTEMIVWGGSLSPEGAVTGGRYDPGTDTWAPMAPGSGAPSYRINQTTVWTGTEMIVWGGGTYDTPSMFNTGGRYNPTLDTWSATSTGANVPTGRWNHSAVWTGTRMIVWGGGANSGPLATGALYDPVANAWTPTGTSGSPPSARVDHSAVWTGSRMVVWGGGNASGPLDSGGLYNPVTNSWTQTSLLGQPAARSRHTAVWTGSSMVVWGGVGSSTPLSTGGRYDPATNLWLTTSTGAGNPAPREGHTAVWADSQMIVWGGSLASGSLTSTGGRYDPTTDTWLPTSGTNAPSARWQHSAVWTGSEMIAWGGDDSVSPVNTGGRYSPATNTWSATSTTSGIPPLPRSFHSAVWTGTQMLVWGPEFTEVGLYCGPVCPSAPDTDADGVGDACDNCPANANAGQSNIDGDALGDVCDTCPADPADDVDNDGVCGNVDNCPWVANPSQIDTDNDGMGNACELGDDIELSVYPDPISVDPSNLLSNGNVVVSNQQQVGQSFTVSTPGQMSGIEFAPLLDTAQASDSVFMDVRNGGQLLGTASITAAGFPPGAGTIPAPLVIGTSGPGFFNLSGLNITVSSGQVLTFVLRTSFPPGVCSMATHLCTAGVVGRSCVTNSQCERALRAGTSGNTYAGGTEIVNGVSNGNQDMAFKVLMYTPERVRLEWTGGGTSFLILRDDQPETVNTPANQIGQTTARQWIDVPPPGSVYYYLVVDAGSPGAIVLAFPAVSKPNLAGERPLKLTEPRGHL